MCMPRWSPSEKWGVGSLTQTPIFLSYSHFTLNLNQQGSKSLHYIDLVWYLIDWLMTALTNSWLHVNITDHERSFVTLKDWKLQLLKLWMRIQNRFFRRMTSSCYCSYQQKPLSMSLSCHLEVKKRTATTSHTRWCHSLRKKELERGMKEGQVERRGCERQKNRQEI